MEHTFLTQKEAVDFCKANDIPADAIRRVGVVYVVTMPVDDGGSVAKRVSKY